MVGNGTGNYIKNTSSTFNPNEDYYTLNSDGKTYTKQNIDAFESGVTYYIRQRSSAFTVKSNGSAEVKTMGDTDNSVVTKKYVDSKEESGTWTPYVEDVANNIKVTFSYSGYYRIGKIVNIYTSVTVNYTNISSSDYADIFKNSEIKGLPFNCNNCPVVQSVFHMTHINIKATGTTLSLTIPYNNNNVISRYPITKSMIYNITNKTSDSIRFNISIICKIN